MAAIENDETVAQIASRFRVHQTISQPFSKKLIKMLLQVYLYKSENRW
jgi:hypothetical protein